jgi:hypothetical protein
MIYKALYSFKLPDKGSNLDIQIQNLTYYHYTIGQWDGKYRILYPTQQARMIHFRSDLKPGKAGKIGWHHAIKRNGRVPNVNGDSQAPNVRGPNASRKDERLPRRR